jgi:hypothetical protein
MRITRQGLIAVITVFVMSRALLIGITGVNIAITPPSDLPTAEHNIAEEQGEFDAAWHRWDVAYYAAIPTIGYWHASEGYERQTVLFFPLVPLLIKILSTLTGLNTLWSGIVISNVAFFFALLFLYDLILVEGKDTATAQRAIFYISFFPVAFHYFPARTEALFLMFSLMAAHSARTGRWKWAAIAGIFASATRLPGVFIAVFVGLEWLRAHDFHLTDIFNWQKWRTLLGDMRRDWLNIAFIVSIPLGLFSYMLYLWYRFGNPLAFLGGVAENGVSSTVDRFVNLFTPVTLQSSILGIIVTILLVVMLRPMAKQFNVNYSIYSVLSLILQYITFVIHGIPRYVLGTFPFFMQLAIWGRFRAFHLAYVIICPAWLAINTLLWQRWFYVSG